MKKEKILNRIEEKAFYGALEALKNLRKKKDAEKERIERLRNNNEENRYLIFS